MATVAPFATFMKLALPTLYPPKPNQQVIRLTLSKDQLNALLQRDQGLEEGEEPMRIEFAEDGRGTLKLDSETVFSLSHPRSSLPSGLSQRREEVYAFTPGSRPGMGSLDGQFVVPSGTPTLEALGEREEKEARVAGAGEKVRGRMEEEREKKMGRSIVVMDPQPVPSRSSTPKPKVPLKSTTARQPKLLAPTLPRPTKPKPTNSISSTVASATHTPAASPAIKAAPFPLTSKQTGGVPMDRAQASSTSSAISVAHSASSSSSSAVPLASSSKLPSQTLKSKSGDMISSSTTSTPRNDMSVGAQSRSQKPYDTSKDKAPARVTEINVETQGLLVSPSKRKASGMEGRAEEEAEEGEEREPMSRARPIAVANCVTSTPAPNSKRRLEKDAIDVHPNKKAKVPGETKTPRARQQDMEEGEEGEVTGSDLSPLSDEQALKNRIDKPDRLAPANQKGAAATNGSLETRSPQPQPAARNFIQTSKSKKPPKGKSDVGKVKSSSSQRMSPPVIGTPSSAEATKKARSSTASASSVATSNAQSKDKEFARPSPKVPPSGSSQSLATSSIKAAPLLNGKKVIALPTKSVGAMTGGPKVSSTISKVKASGKAVNAVAAGKKTCKDQSQAPGTKLTNGRVHPGQDSEIGAVLADRERRRKKGSKARNANGELYFSSSDDGPEQSSTSTHANGRLVNGSQSHAAGAGASPAASAASGEQNGANGSGPKAAVENRVKLPTFRKKGEGVGADNDRPRGTPNLASSYNDSTSKDVASRLPRDVPMDQGKLKDARHINSRERNGGLDGHDTERKVNGDSGRNGEWPRDRLSRQLSPPRKDVSREKMSRPSIVGPSREELKLGPVSTIPQQLREVTSTKMMAHPSLPPKPAFLSPQVATTAKSDVGSKVNPVRKNTISPPVNNTKLAKVNNDGSRPTSLAPPIVSGSDVKWLRFNSLLEEYNVRTKQYIQARRKLDQVKEVVCMRQNQREAGEVIEDVYLIMTMEDLKVSVEKSKNLRAKVVLIKSNLEKAREACITK